MNLTSYRNTHGNTVSYQIGLDNRLTVTVYHLRLPGSRPVRSISLRHQVQAAARKALRASYTAEIDETGTGTPLPHGAYLVSLTRTYRIPAPTR
ncbi:hypothetical protein [Nocardia brasiliensis]|uniref:hypothetical protein n=1 Tax=Nocardia brasiliensis TaxID=37326 RepID=UPI002454D0C1|nr:hypothetical protein [Nocardia brasiliensis]